MRWGLEWDETSQRTITRQGIAKSDGVYPILVSRCEAVFCKDGVMAAASGVFPPVALHGTTAEQIWGGILKSQGRSPLDMANFTQCFILGLISDAAPSNISLVKQLRRARPQNCILVDIQCLAHQTHLCSAPLWTGLGFLSNMFCTTNVLLSAPQSGNVWLDLQTMAMRLVHERFRVVYSPPNPEHNKFSELVVKMTLLDGLDASDVQSARTRDLAAQLLRIFNGDWTSLQIYHHCKLGCGCLSELDSLARAKAAVAEVLFSRKPSIPAISRWTSCVKSSRFYFLANSCHRLLSESFQRLYPSSRQSFDEQAAKGSLVPVSEDELLCMPSSESALFQRKQRHRAKRAHGWLVSRSMTLEVAVATLLTSTADRLLFWIFSTQADQAHKSADARSLPLVQLAGSQSPARASIDSLCKFLSTEQQGPCENQLVFIAQRLRGADVFSTDSAFYGFLQQCVLMLIGEIYDRVVQPFTAWPRRLALLLDDNMSHDARAQVATEFTRASPCCLDEGISLAIRARHQQPDDLLQPGARRLLHMVFSQKISNIACETNFARAGAQHRVQAGKTALLGSMAAKHVLSELTSQTNQRITESIPAVAARSSSDSRTVKLLPGLGHHGVTPPSHSDKQVHKKKTNGWFLFLAEQCQVQVPMPGETKNDARLRIGKDAQLRWWQDVDLRRTYSAKAKFLNRREAKQQGHYTALVRASDELALPVPGSLGQPISSLTLPNKGGAGGSPLDVLPYKPSGCWGIGDTNHGIALGIVESTITKNRPTRDAIISTWKTNYNAVCPPTSLPEANRAHHKQCPPGACWRTLGSSMASQSLSNLKDILRHVRTKKLGFASNLCNQSSQPVVLMFSRSGAIYAWMLVKAKFSPFGMVLAQLVIESHTADCAVLRIKVDPDASSGLLSPTFTSMELLALWTCEGDPRRELKWQVITSYQVNSMSHIQVPVPTEWNSWVLFSIGDDQPGDPDADPTLELRSLVKQSQQATQGAHVRKGALRRQNAGAGNAASSRAVLECDDSDADGDHIEPEPENDQELSELQSEWQDARAAELSARDAAQRVSVSRRPKPPSDSSTALAPSAALATAAATTTGGASTAASVASCEALPMASSSASGQASAKRSADHIATSIDEKGVVKYTRSDGVVCRLGRVFHPMIFLSTRSVLHAACILNVLPCGE